MIYSILQAIHVIVCIVLIVVVLMQSSKGGGLAGAFGGGGDQTVFGGRETATFLSKATTYLAVAFMILSLSLAFLASKRGVDETGKRDQAGDRTGRRRDSEGREHRQTSSGRAVSTRRRPTRRSSGRR